MMPYDDDLTPVELQAFEELARRHEPSQLLEERTVRALLAEGLLRPRARRTLPWVVAAAAASVVLYLGGVATGQWLSSRQATEMISTMEQNHALEAAALVQQTGSAYSQAIAALAQIPTSADSQDVSQGREVALTALYSAANELVRLTPDDPVVVRILQVLDHDRTESDTVQSPATRRVIWF
jgi:hypothetical protein